MRTTLAPLHTCSFSVVVVVVVAFVACVPDNVPFGQECKHTSECFAPAQDAQHDAQCVSTPSGGVCAPIPAARTPTPCDDASACADASFPVEASCVAGMCTCTIASFKAGCAAPNVIDGLDCVCAPTAHCTDDAQCPDDVPACVDGACSAAGQ